MEFEESVLVFYTYGSHEGKNGAEALPKWILVA